MGKLSPPRCSAQSFSTYTLSQVTPTTWVSPAERSCKALSVGAWWFQVLVKACAKKASRTERPLNADSVIWRPSCDRRSKAGAASPALSVGVRTASFVLPIGAVIRPRLPGVLWENVKFQPIDPTMDEIEWAAGFFEAEGWAGAVPRGRRFMIQLSISQYSARGSPAVLSRFQVAMGGRGRVRGPFAGRPTHFMWQAAGRSGVACFFDLWPHLGSVKRRQVSRALVKCGVEPPSAPPPTTALAWCAGLFDGDGSIGLIRLRRSRAPGHRGIHATVTQSSLCGMPDVLVRFHQAIGLGNVGGPSRRAGVRDVYRWQTQQPDTVRRVVDLLWPWLSPVKREQARAALHVIDSQPAVPRGGGHRGRRKASCVRGHDYADVLLYERVSPIGRPYVQRVCRECDRVRHRSSNAVASASG